MRAVLYDSREPDQCPFSVRSQESYGVVFVAQEYVARLLCTDSNSCWSWDFEVDFNLTKGYKCISGRYLGAGCFSNAFVTVYRCIAL